MGWAYPINERESSLKIRIVAISLVLLIGSSLACGQNSSQAAGQAVRPKNLDRVVPRLPSGLSSEEVEERLGEPDARFELDGGKETVLTYRLWEVVFRPSLYKRTRMYIAGERRDQPVAPLDRKVRALNLGSSRGTVEKELGKTEAWQVLDLGSNERLWYGNGRWKLHFVDRRLAGKVLYD
jgi:hypothetical protein